MSQTCIEDLPFDYRDNQKEWYKRITSSHKRINYYILLTYRCPLIAIRKTFNIGYPSWLAVGMCPGGQSDLQNTHVIL